MSAPSFIKSDYFVFTKDEARDRFFVDDRMIRVKQRVHNEYRTNPNTIVDHVIGCLELTGSESVLDLGCGNGFFLAPVARLLPRGSVTGLDIAPGVLAAAHARFAEEGLVADWMEASADDLDEVSDATFDRLMANYMIHYVPDIERCLREARRVLRGGGLFVLSTDSVQTMPEMYRVHFGALERLRWPERLMKGTPKGRLSLENGASMLRAVFDHVRIVPYHDQLRFTDPEPFMEFYTVGHNYCCARSRPAEDLTGTMFEVLYEDVREQVSAQIRKNGAFCVTKSTGSFVCS
jgi:ubiquinone/menaquinone biosynthesis C-methylase UbiE